MERHHRGLVDHHDVVGQWVGPVVAEPSGRAGAEQSVERRRLRGAQCSRDALGQARVLSLGVHRLGDTCRCLACRRSEGPLRGLDLARSATWCAAASRRAIVRVFPVPGPPATTASRRVKAFAAASR